MEGPGVAYEGVCGVFGTEEMRRRLTGEWQTDSESVQRLGAMAAMLKLNREIS